MVVLLVIRFILIKDDKVKLSEDSKKKWIENIDSIVIAGVTALILITFVIRTFYIPSTSMVPTLKVNDYILVNKFVYRFYMPARHDIVVFRPPPEANAEGKDFIKRIVAVEGDTVEVKNGRLYINGVAQNESPVTGSQGFGKEDVAAICNYNINEPPEYDMPKTIVPQGSLFVMGDNRNNSDDSHVWGFLPKENLIGKAVLLFFPPNRIRTF